MADDRLKLRAELLKEAERIITQDRNKRYGEPDEDFQRIAGIASAMGFRIDTGGGEIRELRGSDVSTFMIAFKLSRLMWSPGHRDSWMDIAGYAGCGYETATLEAQRQEAYLNSAGIDPGAEVLMPHPTKVDVINGHFGREVLDAAEKAIIGDPSVLEGMGFILVDATILRSTNAQICEHCESGHRFSDVCGYRIKVRRAN